MAHPIRRRIVQRLPERTPPRGKLDGQRKGAQDGADTLGQIQGCAAMQEVRLRKAMRRPCQPLAVERPVKQAGRQR